MNKLIEIIRRNQFLIGSLLFVAGFVFTRFQYYSIVNLPYLFDDTPVYVGGLNELMSGNIGSTGTTYGYPLFLGLCRLFSDDIVFVTYIQSALTLVTGLLFLLLIKNSFEQLVLPAAVSLTIFTSSLLFVHFETTILTECLFANSVILFTGALAAIIARFSMMRMVIFSLTVIVGLLVRPTGLYMLPIWLLVVVYIAFSTRSVKTVALSASPIFSYYLVLVIIGWTYTKSDPAPSGVLSALATNSLAYLQTDPSLPAHVNRVISNFVVPRQVAQEVDYIRSGKDVLTVSALYLKYQTYSYAFRDSLLAANNGSNAGLSRDYAAIVDVLRNRYTDDLRRFFKIQFLHYFDSFDHRRTSAYPFFESFQTCFREARVVNYSQHAYNKTGYVGTWNLFRAPQYTIEEVQSKYNAITASSNSFAPKFFSLHHKVFRNKYWVYGYLVATLVCTFLLFRNGERRNIAMFVGMLSLANIVYMVVVSVNISMIRYNFPLHFVFYAVVLMVLPMAWGRAGRLAEDAHTHKK